MKKYKKLSEKEECLVLYSDGFMVKKKEFTQVGAAVVRYHKGVEVFSKKIRMGGKAEVYDVEMAGLMMGTKSAMRFTMRQPEVTQIHYFVDNGAAAGAIFNPKAQPGQIYAAKFP
jgi:hypothetical protein